MDDQERKMAEKLIDAIKDNTKAQWETARDHSEMFNIAFLTTTVFFVIAILVYIFN